MPNVEINVAEVMAIWTGGVLLLLPVLAMVVRWALVPLVDAAARYRSVAAEGAALPELRERFARQEARLVEMTRAVERLESSARPF